jgi:phosphatidylglycerol:prolipoprotein diacylglycerol transferase
MYPVIVQIGPITVYSFGIMMAIAFLVAAFVTAKEFRRHGFDPELVSNLVLWAAIGGLVGARLFLVFEDPGGFFRDPVHTLFSGSGFVWYGGFFGGLAAAVAWIRRHGLPVATVFDCAAPALPLGHAIGRIGCHLAGDGDWGRVTSLPWGVAYRNAIIGWPHPEGVLVHPTPLYEAFAYTAIFLFLWARRTKTNVPGQAFATYLLLGGLARFLIEFVRINPEWALGLSLAQWISLGLVVSAAAFLAGSRIRARAGTAR